ncbi:hypothetical protein L1D14_03810 [Vibrio tubiashii]|uniref:hypothetical protein n=1 Tax=Vibrio tubiashii TaxID=29498 RepID=UPI001EFDE2E6|nr:hypothetical protein [Vibrio tubiashii]MCG9575356.1 hypothetical protein [Vibrio tubiashii]
MRTISLSLLILVLSSPAHSSDGSECESDYVSHINSVMTKIVSHDPTSKSLGSAQRDCLAYHLQEQEELCPAFREFEEQFLSQSVSTQINQGEDCRNAILRLHFDQ